MATVKSFEVYTHFPNYVSSDAARPLRRPPARHSDPGAIATPCCIPLQPADAAGADAAGVALLARRQGASTRPNSFGVLAIELPDPSSLGAFDGYEAVLFEPGVVSFVVPLSQTPGLAWAGLLTGISQELSPTMRVIVRPADSTTGASGPPILTGSADSCVSQSMPARG